MEMKGTVDSKPINVEAGTIQERVAHNKPMKAETGTSHSDVSGEIPTTNVAPPLPADVDGLAQEPPKKMARTQRRVVPRSEIGDEAGRLGTNRVLLETSARMDNAIVELMDCIVALSDESKENRPRRRDAVTSISDHVLPLIHIASRSLWDTGISLAPFGGTHHLHHRDEARRRREIVDKSSDKSPAAQMIDHFVKKSIVEIPERIARLNSAVRKGEVPATAKREVPASITEGGEEETETETITIVRPRNGAQYTRSEALRVCKMYRKGSRERSRAIRAMIHMGYCPVSNKSIYRLCQAEEEGHMIVNDRWNEKGRPPKELRSAEEVARAVVPPLPMPEAGELEQVTMPKRGGKRKEEEGGCSMEEGAKDAEGVGMLMESRGKGKGGGREKVKKPQQGSMASLFCFGDVGGVSLMKAPSLQTASEPRGKESKSPEKPKEKNVSHSVMGKKVKSPGRPKEKKVPQRVMGTQAKSPGKPKGKKVPKAVIDFYLPKPRDGGTVYKKSEAVALAKQFQKGSQERRWCLEAMIHRGYVPNSIKSMYRLLQRDEKGLPIADSEWSSPGCPALLSDEEVDAVLEKLKNENGRIYGPADVELLLANAVREKRVREGKDPGECEVRFSKASVKNYEIIFRSRLSSIYWKGPHQTKCPNNLNL